MGRRELLPFLLVAAAAWGLFAGAGLWFADRLEQQHRQDIRHELALVTESAAANVAGYVDRVTRAVRSALAEPLGSGDNTLEALTARYRILSQSYPEIHSLIYVDADRAVYTAAPGQDLKPAALRVSDVLEGPELEHHLGLPPSAGLQVRVSGITRYDASLDRVIHAPVLLFVQQLPAHGGNRGTVLVPYLLDFIAETLLAPLASSGRRELTLITPRGVAVYSTLPELRHGSGMPSFSAADRPGSHDAGVPPSQGADAPGEAFFAGFETRPASGTTRHTGRFVPLELGGARWTLAGSSLDQAPWPHRSELLLPPLVGSLALVVLLCGVAFMASRSTQRHLREITRFRAAVTASGMGIAMFDQDDRYLYVNPAYTEITGVSAEQALGRQVQTRSTAFEDPELLGRILPQVRSGHPWSGQARLRRPDGEDEVWHDLAFTVSPIVENGAFRGYVTSALNMSSEARVRRQLEAQAIELATAKRALEDDIQAREKAEHEKDLLQQELRRSQTLEAVGQLAGGVAHDFNNILGSIIGCLYAVEQQVGDAPAIAREIENVKDLCKRGGELNRQLLAVGRRDTGPRTPVDAGEFLANICLLLKRTLPPHVALAVVSPEGLPRIRGNRSNLLAAFLNLGLNARDAMPEGGTLTIRAYLETEQRAPDSIVVEVEDTGTGIPAEIQERVFEPFFTTKRAGVGTGLGLATAHAAVEECGGSITLRSTPGVGTRFTVRLPVVERRTRTRVGQQPPTQHPGTALPVLVIEDEPGVERLIHGTLRAAGYAVASAVDGAEAMRKIRDGNLRFGAVTLDLMLPEVSGSEVFRELRKARPEVPVLVVTARDDLARRTIKDAPYLTKPFTAVELLTAVGHLFPGPMGGDAQPTPEERTGDQEGNCAS